MIECLNACQKIFVRIGMIIKDRDRDKEKKKREKKCHNQVFKLWLYSKILFMAVTWAQYPNQTGNKTIDVWFCRHATLMRGQGNQTGIVDPGISN